MKLTDEMILECDKRFRRQNIIAELEYCGKEIPTRKSIKNNEILFYAWLCRSAAALLKEREAVKPNIYTSTGAIFDDDDRLEVQIAECGNCGRNLITPGSSEMYTYCPKCGRRVNWSV